MFRPLEVDFATWHYAMLPNYTKILLELGSIRTRDSEYLMAYIQIQRVNTIQIEFTQRVCLINQVHI